MPDENSTTTDPNKIPKWTLMFYFASDNPLGPAIVSQLKALKQAGFHPDANVIAYYDPPIPGTPTHIFDVNIVEKIKAHGEARIGFTAKDSFVRNMVQDKLWGKLPAVDGGTITDLIRTSLEDDGVLYNPSDPSDFFHKKKARKSAKSNGNSGHADEDTPETSLGSFLKFCSKKYPAQNYALFILGHGLVVGNDLFLYDESSPTHSLSLTKLGLLLKTFKSEIKKNVGEKVEFQLVSFHSCSMSSLEVAYELKNTANYMLASQCPTSVGAWPYRQILIRVLKQLEDEKDDEKYEQQDVDEVISDIFDYCAYNSFDFQLAGYSFDLCLCDLRNTDGVKKNLDDLSRKLIAGLEDPRAKDLILLAHWDAQSYWGEMYTDLFDFCLCLQRRCKDALPANETQGTVAELETACGNMIEVLTPNSFSAPKKLIKRTRFVGSAYQYARGLSVYFPWSKPLHSSFWPKQYGAYKLIAGEPANGKSETDEELTKRSKETPSWGDFLDKYFDKTMRKTRQKETAEAAEEKGETVRRFSEPTVDNEGIDALSLLASDDSGIHAIGDFLGGDKVGGGDATGGDPGKVGGGDGTGGDCYYSTVKNYPPFTRAAETQEAAPERANHQAKG
jgi:hypothetical protein